MKWIDVMGTPGAGKSTVCDPLWGPHAINHEAPIDPPSEWHYFLSEIDHLFGVVSGHPSFVPVVRMCRRSTRKIAHVRRLPGPERGELPPAYCQTALGQRGLGFGWRLTDLNLPVDLLYNYFNTMPVSIGCAFLLADPAVLKDRNKARESVPETAHENRTHMVDLMQPAIEFAKEVLYERRVPVWNYDTAKMTAEEIRLDLREKMTWHECTPRELKPIIYDRPTWWD